MINLILRIAAIGVVVWLICLSPIADAFKTIIVAVVVICMVVWLMHVFGVADIPVPRLH